MQSNNQEKTILFRMWRFPGYCETFIISQIIIAIKCGYKVQILVEDLNEFKKGIHKEVVEEFEIYEKIVEEDYKIPKSKILRIMKATGLFLINFICFFHFVKFLKYSKGSTIEMIYQFNFLRKLNSYDIIHVQYGTNVKPLDVLKELGILKSKIVVSFHGHDLYFPINGRIPNNGYYDRTFKYADLLVANTFYLKSLLINLGASEEKIKTIPVSVDTNFFYPIKRSKNKGPIKIITVGRLEVFKGQNFGVECISRLIEKGYNVHFMLIGDGTQKDYLQKLVRKKKLENHITLAGRKTQEEVRGFLREQDIFLMTSITDPDYGVESQGLVTAEAQASGLPVIAFDSGGVKYTFENGKTGFLVPEGDVKEMVNKIEKVIQNDQLREQMSKAAVRYIDINFSQKRINKNWCQVYNALIN